MKTAYESGCEIDSNEEVAQRSRNERRRDTAKAVSADQRPAPLGGRRRAGQNRTPEGDVKTPCRARVRGQEQAAQLGATIQTL